LLNESFGGGGGGGGGGSGAGAGASVIIESIFCGSGGGSFVF